MISHIDHIVLTVADIEASVAFFKRVLKMNDSTFANGRRAMHFGNQKINLHEVGREFVPRARVATAGSGDFCLLSERPVAEIAAHLVTEGIEVIDGPVPKTGATGPLMSIYFRDPAGNSLEFAEPRIWGLSR